MRFLLICHLFSKREIYTSMGLKTLALHWNTQQKPRPKYMANMAAGAGKHKDGSDMQINIWRKCVCVISGSRTPRQRHRMDVSCARGKAFLYRDAWKWETVLSSAHVFMYPYLSNIAFCGIEWSKAAHFAHNRMATHTDADGARANAWGRGVNIISKFQYSIWTHKTEFRIV